MSEQLTDPDLEVMISAIVAAFADEPRVFELATRGVDTGVSFIADIKPGAFRFRVTDFLTEVNRQAKVDAVLAACLQARAGDADLRQAIGGMRPKVLEAVPESVHRVAAALRALAGVLGSQDVQDILVKSSDDLAKAANILAMLAGYKSLHDCLHTVQMLPYQLMAQALPEFETSEIVRLTFDQAVDDVARRLDDAERIAGKIPDAGRRENEQAWINRLGEVLAALRVPPLDAVKAREGVYGLKQVLRIQLPRLDTLLASAARDLPLDRVEQTFTAVVDLLPADDPVQAQMRDGLLGLTRLRKELADHIREHEGWQEVDSLLWLAQDALDRQEFFELDVTWKELGGRLNALCPPPPPTWGTALLALASAFQEALPSKAPTVRESFRSLLSAGRRRFFDVDRDLNERLIQVDRLRPSLEVLLTKVKDAV